MSTAFRTVDRRHRSLVPTVGAVLGLVMAAGWFFGVRQIARASQRATQASALEHAAQLVEVLRALTQDRVKADAQMLAEDPRLKSTLSAANVDDATLLDMLQDLQQLNDQALFAVLSPSGRVTVELGAPRLKGVDLGTSSVVQAALAHEGAALGTWLVGDRVEEIGVAAVRVGERPVALLVIGARLDDAALAGAARAAGVHLALLVEEKPVWADQALPPETWADPDARSVEVKGSVPAARYVAVAPPVEEATWTLAWAVPLAALGFAVLAFSRGGTR